MTRRLLRACVGAALVGMLSVPAHGIAKPPDLPEDGTFTATPVMASPAPLFRLRPTARRTFAGSLLFSIHPVFGFLPTDKVLDAPSDHPHPAGDDDVLSDTPRLELRTLAGSLLSGLPPVFGILPTDEVRDAPSVPPPPAGEDDVLSDAPPRELEQWFAGSSRNIQLPPSHYGDWFSWLVAHWTARHRPLTPEQNDGYVRPEAPGLAFACRAAQEEPISENETLAPTIEVLPMPREDSGITCPFLRQQRIDKHACQFADPEIGRDVLANLESLKEADNLLELATELARDGFFVEAMVCCEHAAKLCPGSPCAERALNNLHELARGVVPQVAGSEESAEPQPDEPSGPCSRWDSFWRETFESMGLPVKAETASVEPGVEPLVGGLMKACHLLMSQGMQHQAAELARQAYALDPQRVMADPLIYKMHLLAGMSSTTGSSEESEPPTCPYCPKVGKPIHEIVLEEMQSEDGPTTLLVPPLPRIDYEVVPALEKVLTEMNSSEEASEESTPESMRELIETMLDGSVHTPFAIGIGADGGLLVFGDCSLGKNVYHLRYTHGCIAIWETTDASKTKP